MASAVGDAPEVADPWAGREVVGLVDMMREVMARGIGVALYLPGHEDHIGEVLFVTEFFVEDHLNPLTVDLS